MTLPQHQQTLPSLGRVLAETDKSVTYLDVNYPNGVGFVGFDGASRLPKKNATIWREGSNGMDGLEWRRGVWHRVSRSMPRTMHQPPQQGFWRRRASRQPKEGLSVWLAYGSGTVYRNCLKLKADGSVSALSGGTWQEIPVGGKLKLDINLPGEHYVRRSGSHTVSIHRTKNKSRDRLRYDERSGVWLQQWELWPITEGQPFYFQKVRFLPGWQIQIDAPRPFIIQLPRTFVCYFGDHTRYVYSSEDSPLVVLNGQTWIKHVLYYGGTWMEAVAPREFLYVSTINWGPNQFSQDVCNGLVRVYMSGQCEVANRRYWPGEEIDAVVGDIEIQREPGSQWITLRDSMFNVQCLKWDGGLWLGGAETNGPVPTKTSLCGRVLGYLFGS